MRLHTKSIIRLLSERLEEEPRSGAEVGVWRGGNAADLLAHFKNLSLLLVDAYDAKLSRSISNTKQDEYQKAFEEAWTYTFPYRTRSTFLLTDTLTAAESVEDQSLDFVFLDASHDFDSVRDDILAWRSKVRPGGIMCGHDYDGRGDKKGFFGVRRAVHSIFEDDQVMKRAGLVWAVQV